MIYDLIAPFYDEVNKEISYADWADFIEKIISLEYRHRRPELLLDLGCGTGKMTLELARRGYDMTGVDVSPEMLDLARESAEREGFDGKILWLCQDMTELELYGTVDVAVSCLDCINHLATKASLEKCLSLVHNYLIPDGLFIFDINGRSKFETVYSDNTYVMEADGKVCIWQNYYDNKSSLCDFYITVFEEGADGRYERYDDVQRERMYTLRSIKSSLNKTGFEFIGAYSDYDFKEATDADGRIYIAARCIKE